MCFFILKEQKDKRLRCTFRDVNVKMDFCFLVLFVVLFGFLSFTHLLVWFFIYLLPMVYKLLMVQVYRRWHCHHTLHLAIIFKQNCYRIGSIIINSTRTTNIQKKMETKWETSYFWTAFDKYVNIILDFQLQLLSPYVITVRWLLFDIYSIFH